MGEDGGRAVDVGGVGGAGGEGAWAFLDVAGGVVGAERICVDSRGERGMGVLDGLPFIGLGPNVFEWEERSGLGLVDSGS